MLTGVSRIDSIFSRSNARARAPGRSAANSSRCRRASAAIRSRRARSLITMKSQGWEKPTDGAWWAAASTRRARRRAPGRAEPAADVPPLGDHPVDGVPLLGRKALVSGDQGPSGVAGAVVVSQGGGAGPRAPSLHTCGPPGRGRSRAGR